MTPTPTVLELLVVLLFICSFFLTFYGISLLRAGEIVGIGVAALMFAVVCFAAAITLAANENKQTVYYNAICNEAIYNVYETDGNYYLTETDAKTILPNCVLIENQSD